MHTGVAHDGVEAHSVLALHALRVDTGFGLWTK
jgi:hypothetical protein